MPDGDMTPQADAVEVTATCPTCGDELRGLHHGDDPDEGTELLLRGHSMARHGAP